MNGASRIATCDEPSFSNATRFLSEQAPPSVAVLGDLGLLRGHTLALFCSVRCPGDVILRTLDLAVELRDAGVTVVGGFHTPMEKECLAILLRGRQPLVICPARAIEGMRLPPSWKQAVDAGRLLVLSPFPEPQRRVTTETALVRNRFAAAVAERVFIAYAAPTGKTEQLARDAATWGKPLLTVATESNARLMAMGAEPFALEPA